MLEAIHAMRALQRHPPTPRERDIAEALCIAAASLEDQSGILTGAEPITLPQSLAIAQMLPAALAMVGLRVEIRDGALGKS